MFGLPDETIFAMRQVFKGVSGVERVILYGSRAKECERPGSDIDLALIGDLDTEGLSRLRLALDDLNTPYLMDISMFDQISSKSLIEHINRVGKTFYERKA